MCKSVNMDGWQYVCMHACWMHVCNMHVCLYVTCKNSHKHSHSPRCAALCRAVKPCLLEVKISTSASSSERTSSRSPSSAVWYFSFIQPVFVLMHFFVVVTKLTKYAKYGYIDQDRIYIYADTI